MAMYIDVTPLPGEGMYQLNKAIIIDGNHIPAGIKFDGASIPKFLWPIIGSPFDPRFMVPSLDHDFNYEKGINGKYSRKRSDKRFKKLLKANGVDDERAESMYLGVRRGGGSHYNRKKTI